jgi:O-antigen/teichoic acid export membrane protein
MIETTSKENMSSKAIDLRQVACRPRATSSFWRVLRNPLVYGSFIPIVTALNAIAGMVLPTMMEPRILGQYALVVTLFQYGLIFDLGVSPLIDRFVPYYLGTGRAAEAESIGQRLLWLRLYIGGTTYTVTVAILIGLALFHSLPFDLHVALLSALAGILYMLALGPPGVYRARSQRSNYAICVGLLSSGLFVARLGGLYFGGLVGCFAALSAWYLVCGLAIHSTMLLRYDERPTASQAFSLVIAGIPFFSTSFIWAFYLTANRWISSPLIEPLQFGQFAFSMNIMSLLVGTAGGFSAFYYPRIIAEIAKSPAFGLSSVVTADCTKLMLAAGLVVAGGIVLAGPLLPLIYPSYVAALPTLRILLVAVPALVLASWLMPILLSVAHRPWLEGIIIYPGATIVLAVGIHVLLRYFGVVGAAWASTPSALALVGLQLAALGHAHVLRPGAAMRLGGITVVMTAALGALLWT